MENTLLIKDTIQDWDVHFALWSASAKYIYYKPLCYQLFPATENSKNWGRESGWLLLFVPLIRFILQALLLDKQAQPGFDVVYFVAKLWFWVLILLIVWIGLRRFTPLRI